MQRQELLPLVVFFVGDVSGSINSFFVSSTAPVSRNGGGDQNGPSHLALEMENQNLDSEDQKIQP